ncbi:MAG: hypothetical protein KA194_07495, partial [Alcaligenes sp.]|nr:hypothetical protein [Alcaligenes sp.]
FDALQPSTFIVFGLPSQLGLQFNTSRRVICAKSPLFSALKTSFGLKCLSGLEPHLCSCYMQIIWEQTFAPELSPFYYDLEQTGVQTSNFSDVPALALKPAPGWR